MFVVILAATPENRVAKRADFPTRAEADAHVVLFLDLFPDAFVASMPDAPDGHWLIDMVAKTIGISPPPPEPTPPESAERRAIRALAATLGSAAVAVIEAEIGVRR